MNKPPKLFLRFFRWYCHPKLMDHIEGDLIEVYQQGLKKFGKRKADIKFIIDVLLLFRPRIIKPIQESKNISHYGMYKSYFKIGWRNLLQSRLFSLIKISGLSIGLTVCILVFLFTKDELSYDQFHKNKSDIYRVIQTWHHGADEPHVIGITNAVVAEAFANEIPEIRGYTRLNGAPVSIKINDDIFTENPLFVDESFLTVFSFSLLKGEKTTALKNIHSVIVSTEMAQKYFGNNDVIGRFLEIKFGDKIEQFTVTGLIETSPNNSSIKTDMLLPFQYFEKNNSNKGWFGGSLNTFLLLDPGADIRAVASKMQALFDKNVKDDLGRAMEARKVNIKIEIGLQPLTGIHLGTEAGPDNGLSDGSSLSYSYMLSSIAIFILAIACINFINLAVSQSIKRSKEIGIRKVIGGTRQQLIRQFLVESFIITFISFGIAMVLAALLLPSFNSFANKKLDFSHLADPYAYGGCIILLLATTLLAGVYPSLVLSSPQPIKVLQGRYKLMSKSYFTRGLIVVQFALTMFLIISTLVVNSQLDFIQHTDLGYDSRNLVRIDIPVSNESETLPAQFKSELLGRKNVVNVAARHGGRSISGVMADNKMIEIENNKIDDQFLPTFKIPIIAGRNFAPEFPADSLNAVIVNEAFLKEADWDLNTAVGKAITFISGKRHATIVGVIRDYHFSSLKEQIKPALFSMNPSFNFGQVWVKIGEEDIPETLALLERTFKKLVPYFPYTYQFMDDINTRNYSAETKGRQIILGASVLFIFISGIGLFGLVILSVEQRTKEIGIRKVLGATATRIVGLISKEFITLTLISFVIATPLGYVALNQWLNKFAYHVSLNWWLFAIAGLSVITLSLFIIGFQAIRVTMTNPVKSLRSD